MDISRFRTPVVYADANQQILGVSLGILDEYIKLAVIIENAGIE